MTDRFRSLDRKDHRERGKSSCALRPRPDRRYETGTQKPSLCQRCVQINFGELVPGRRVKSTRAVRLGRASEIVADKTCSLCQLFGRTFQQKLFRVNDQVYYLYPFYTSHIHAHKWVYSPRLQGISETISFAIVEMRDLQSTWSGNAWGMRDTIKRSGWISPVTNSSAVSSFTGRKLEQMADFTVIKGWLDFCTSNHRQTCGFIPSRTMLPIKVIDCVSRIIATAAPGWDYVALSYVWGQSSLTESEARSTINDRVLLAPLPNVIEDAIIATQKLGFRYLWIDRYCIDQLDTEHKKSQIQQMDLVYSRASCTIIAAAGCDPTAGLPGTSTMLREPSFSVTTQHDSYVSVPPDPVLKIECSVWNSRGWTFQEALLSRRCLVFCNDQVYFTCGGMTCRDPIYFPLTALHRKNLQRFSTWNENWNDYYNDSSRDDRLFRFITAVRYPFHECSKLIQIYARRSLSDSNDILNGILGIFQRFKTVHLPFRQFYGIILVPDVTLLVWQDREAGEKRKIRKSSFTEQLVTGLCWDVDRSMNLFQSGARRHGFPSWSWTGWVQRLTIPTTYDGYMSNTHGLSSDLFGLDWSGSRLKSTPPAYQKLELRSKYIL